MVLIVYTLKFNLGVQIRKEVLPIVRRACTFRYDIILGFYISFSVLIAMIVYLSTSPLFPSHFLFFVIIPYRGVFSEDL